MMMKNKDARRSAGMAVAELDVRSREVPRLVVESWVGDGEPVGSRSLSRLLSEKLSPATIRTVMADLEDYGLLYAPHVSAGRLPTDAGLRLFVDGLLEAENLSEEERREIEVQCAAEGRSAGQVLEDATALMSGLGRCAGLVVAPRKATRFRHIEFVALGPGRALVVMVTEQGLGEPPDPGPHRHFRLRPDGGGELSLHTLKGTDVEGSGRSDPQRHRREQGGARAIAFQI